MSIYGNFAACESSDACMLDPDCALFADCREVPVACPACGQEKS